MAVRVPGVLDEQIDQSHLIGRIAQVPEVCVLGIAATRQNPVFVKHVRDAPGHPGGEVAPYSAALPRMTCRWVAPGRAASPPPDREGIEKA